MYRIHTRSRLAAGFVVLAALAWAGCDNPIELDESGELVLEDVRAGTGEEAVAGRRIHFHAFGTLTNGRIFTDSQELESQPPLVFTLGAKQVIEGLDTGIVGMKEGGIRKITIPPRLAFGTQSSDEIPANSTVIFQVELLRVEHPDSLTVEDLVQGSGALVDAGDTLTVNYYGYLGNGARFDNGSYRFVMGAGRVIPGWEEGLLGIRQGGQRLLTIPPRLAYGNQPYGVIPANSTLVFDVTVTRVGKN